MTQIITVRTFFRPTDIGGLFAWYDASDLAAITDAGSGAVSQWNDKGSNAYHLTQGTAGNRPTTGTRSQNGRNVLDFDASDNLDKTGTSAFSQPRTVFAVAQADNFTGDRSIIDSVSQATTRNLLFADTALTPDKWSMYAGASLNSSSTADTNPHVFCATFDTTSSTLHIDGVSEASGTAGTQSGPTTIRIGAKQDQSGDWDGWIAEVILYSGALSTADRQKVEAYLRSKWGI